MIKGFYEVSLFLFYFSRSLAFAPGRVRLKVEWRRLDAQPWEERDLQGRIDGNLLGAGKGENRQRAVPQIS